MEMNLAPFENEKDFKSAYFYYFLPHFTIKQQAKIGELITKYKGVSDNFNNKYYII